MPRVLFVQLDPKTSKFLKGSGAIPSEEGIEETSAKDFSAEKLNAESYSELDAIVLGSGLNEPVQLTQKIHGASKKIPVVILARPDRCPQINRALQFTPLLGDEISCHPESEPEAAATLLRNVIEKSQKQRKLRMTLANIQAKQAEAQRKPPHPADVQFLERLLDYAPIGVLALDRHGQIMTWNAKADEILAAKTESFLGTSVFSLLPLSTLQFEKPATLQRKNPKGERQWIEITAAPITGRGREEGTLIILQDITARKQTEERLKAANRRISFVSESTKTFLTDVDFQARLRMLSQFLVTEFADWCAIDLFEQDGSAKPGAVACKDPEKIPELEELRKKYPPDPRRKHPVFEVSKTGKSILIPKITQGKIDALAQSAEHARLLRSLGMKSALLVPLTARGRVFGVVTLITGYSGRQLTDSDRATAEELAQRAALALDNSSLYQQSLDSVRIRDEFISIASHELKTPITSLMLQNDLTGRMILQKNPAAFDPQRLGRMQETTSKQLARLLRLVEDMLEVSRISSGKLSFEPSEFDLVELVREVCSRFEEQFKAIGTHVSIRAPKAPLEGRWDPYRTEQVIVNLLSNALKYGEGKPVEVWFESDERTAKLFVKDQGVGIAKEDQTRIFDQFERAISRDNISGFGLGLYITRKIVEAQGGTIRVESELGSGSTFIVELPL